MTRADRESALTVTSETITIKSHRAMAIPREVLKLLLYRVGFLRIKYRGVFSSYQEALAAVRPNLMVGWDHDQVAPLFFDAMCELVPWDRPVLKWLRRLLPQTRCLVDAGGHLGTKYRAFREHLELGEGLRWIVYDVPAVVRAGRERAISDGLLDLSFIDRMSDAPAPDIMLASGLLQYLDIPFQELLAQLPALPQHLILNKVATRDGPSIVTLENIGCAEVPYQIRNREDFLSSLATMGYEVVDEWEIPELSHVITTNPFCGASSSRGYYARLLSVRE